MTCPESSHLPMTESSIDSIEETWVSAFIDGEATLDEQGGWSERVHERLYYYTVTRQVLRGVLPCPEKREAFHSQRATWADFWSRVDSA